MTTTNNGLWQVFDLNQGGKNQPPRFHLVAGKDWPLFRDEGCPMPPHIAAVFLRDPAFRVVDENNNVQVTLPDAEARDSARTRPHLEPGEVIAKMEELQHSALLARAVLRPGGKHFNRATKREELIAFLKTAPLTAEMDTTERPRNTGAPDRTDDDLSDRELDSVLGPKPTVDQLLAGS